MASQFRNVKFENNYAPLKLYNPSMGVPITSFLEKNLGVQQVADFKGFDYTNPNYNTLVSDTMSNYPTVLKGYQEFCPNNSKDCVSYPVKQVPCNTAGGSGPKGPVNFRM